MKIKFPPAFVLLFAALFAVLFTASSGGVFAQKKAAALVVVVDPTKISKEAAATAADEKFVKNLLPKVRKIWTKEACEEEFSITGVATGAFTKKKVVQKAFLYEFCRTGNGFAFDGIVIAESGRLVAHFIYEGAWTGGLTKLPDINGNGLDELFITNFGGMHQGVSAVGIDVIEFSGASFREIGAMQIGMDDDGGVEGDGETPNTFSYKITVKSGATPVFYREKFVQNDKNAWLKVGKIERAAMFALDYKYTPIK